MVNGPSYVALETLRQLLSQCPAALQRQEILARWTKGEPPPRDDSQWRSPMRGIELGILFRTEEGNKAEAFR